jgi:hypothetical protein
LELEYPGQIVQLGLEILWSVVQLELDVLTSESWLQRAFSSLATRKERPS